MDLELRHLWYAVIGTIVLLIIVGVLWLPNETGDDDANPPE